MCHHEQCIQHSKPWASLLVFASVLLSLNVQTQRAHTQMGTAGWKRKIDGMCERLPRPVISAQSMRHMTTLWEAWNYSRAYVKAPLAASFFLFLNCTDFTTHSMGKTERRKCTAHSVAHVFRSFFSWLDKLFWQLNTDYESLSTLLGQKEDRSSHEG